MEILHTSKDLSSLPQKTLSDCVAGRWYHGHRVFILKTDSAINPLDHVTEYAAVSLNIFERIIAFIYHLFNQNYFSKISAFYDDDHLIDNHAIVLDTDSVAAVIKKGSDSAKKSAVIPESPLAENHDLDRVEEFMRKQNEKEAEIIANVFLDLTALEIIFTDLEQPQNFIMMDELKEAASFANEYIQKNANEDSIEFSKDTFSDHSLLSHFDTLIAATRRLVTSEKIKGYIVNSDKTVIKIALNDQSELLQKESFVNKDVLVKTIIIPAFKKIRDSEEAENKPVANPEI
jgi:hypothetical protein